MPNGPNLNKIWNKLPESRKQKINDRASLLKKSLDQAEKEGKEFSSEEVFEPLRARYRNMLEGS